MDAVEPWQVRGWAFDPTLPGEAVSVQILLDDRLLAEGPAELFREDLEQSGVGNGSHAFIFNLERSLNREEADRICAQAASKDGLYIALPLTKLSAPAEVPASPLRRPIELPVSCSDETQRPVFILGAARSGTSAMAQALLKLGKFEGNEEGHVLDLLAHLSVALHKFYELNHEEITGGRNTAISRVPVAFFETGLNAMFVDLARRLFPSSRWLDKTPNSNMVHLAPRFREIWPHSRFIFMRRRFLENAVSRSRKFPEFEFERNAREWGRAMEAWLDVRPQLHGAAIEIDQKFLSEDPDLVAKHLAQFLSLTETEEARLSQALRYDQPERTSPTRRENYDLSQMNWGAVENGYFSQHCQTAMAAFGYSTDAAYYLPGFETDGFLYV